MIYIIIFQLCKFVEDERKKAEIYPPYHQVYSGTNMCSIEQVKVVILRQDPCHRPRQAHGLCFSVQVVVKPPPSLVNMFKELKSDIEGFDIRKHGTLTGWAEQDKTSYFKMCASFSVISLCFFFGCKHFSQCNKLLVDQGFTPIDWTKQPPK